jgi:hypothetical protein
MQKSHGMQMQSPYMSFFLSKYISENSSDGLKYSLYSSVWQLHNLCLFSKYKLGLHYVILAF